MVKIRLGEPFVCKQCIVWRKPQDAMFATVEDAERHAIESHPGRFLALYNKLATVADLLVDREHLVRQTLFNQSEGIPPNGRL